MASRILLVDDEPDSVYILARSLEKRGFGVLTAYDGPSALQMAKHKLPDLILLDVKIPTMSGFEICRKLKLDPITASIPVVFISAVADSKSKVKGFQLGAFDYITRPYDLDELEARINRILQIHQDNAALSRKARLDSLTGVFNHGTFNERLDVELVKSKENHTAILCLMLDIDHFKHVNDTYGHAAGDQALQSLVDILRLMCRGGDLIGRYGGEEFVVMLLGTELQVACRIAERIRQAVHDAHICTKAASFKITVSLGVVGTEGDTTAEDLIARADRAMYHAKNSGRNRVAYEEAGIIQLL